MSICIIKVGGSLLDLPDLGQRLQDVCRQRSTHRCVLFPGGGDTANLIRAWHKRFHFSEETSHHLAVGALDLNAELLSALTPAFRLISRLEPRSDSSIVEILRPRGELDQLEQQFPDTAPPHLWDVTSDSLAAWVAIKWQATELVLLKSVDCRPERRLADAVRDGSVDAYFPGIAGEIPRVNWCNLRAEDRRIVAWLAAGEPVSKIRC